MHLTRVGCFFFLEKKRKMSMGNLLVLRDKGIFKIEPARIVQAGTIPFNAIKVLQMGHFNGSYLKESCIIFLQGM